MNARRRRMGDCVEGAERKIHHTFGPGSSRDHPHVTLLVTAKNSAKLASSPSDSPRANHVPEPSTGRLMACPGRTRPGRPLTPYPAPSAPFLPCSANGATPRVRPKTEGLSWRAIISSAPAQAIGTHVPLAVSEMDLRSRCHLHHT